MRLSEKVLAEWRVGLTPNLDDVATKRQMALLDEIQRLRALIGPVWQGTTFDGTFYEDEDGSKMRDLVIEAIKVHRGE